jgi:hypothetical protein
MAGSASNLIHKNHHIWIAVAGALFGFPILRHVDAIVNIFYDVTAGLVVVVKATGIKVIFAPIRIIACSILMSNLDVYGFLSIGNFHFSDLLKCPWD